MDSPESNNNNLIISKIVILYPWKVCDIIKNAGIRVKINIGDVYLNNKQLWSDLYLFYIGFY